MSNETIPLSKGYNEKKIEFPGFLSIKLDGVPVRLDITVAADDIDFSVRTRQGEPVVSTTNQISNFLEALMLTNVIKHGRYTFVFEVTHKTLSAFKDVSGVVRRQEPQDDLVLNLFDFQDHQEPELTFQERQVLVNYIMQHMTSDDFHKEYQYYVSDAKAFHAISVELFRLFPNCEGLVYRAASAIWEPATRRWNYLKVLNEPTADVRVVGFEEAVCGKTGVGKGMVGRVNIVWKDGKVHGVGPGKMTHAERKKLFSKYGTAPIEFGSDPLFATIKYKKDDTYAGPRQGTFQHWRPEKTEASFE